MRSLGDFPVLVRGRAGCCGDASAQRGSQSALIFNQTSKPESRPHAFALCRLSDDAINEVPCLLLVGQRTLARWPAIGPRHCRRQPIGYRSARSTRPEMNPHLEELGQFLKSRGSELISHRPAAAPEIRARRVTGLRREEVNGSVGISPDYYTRIEHMGRTSTSLPGTPWRELLADLDQISPQERNYVRMVFTDARVQAPYDTGRAWLAPVPQSCACRPSTVPTARNSQAWSASLPFGARSFVSGGPTGTSPTRVRDQDHPPSEAR
jgi:hypothetical protein